MTNIRSLGKLAPLRGGGTLQDRVQYQTNSAINKLSKSLIVRGRMLVQKTESEKKENSVQKYTRNIVMKKDSPNIIKTGSSLNGWIVTDINSSTNIWRVSQKDELDKTTMDLRCDVDCIIQLWIF